MFRKPVGPLVLIAGLLLSSCELIGPDNKTELRTLTKDEENLVQSDNRFGLKFFRTINTINEDQNVFLSPLSVSMALGMTLNGAREQTRADMERTLELSGMSDAEMNEAYRGLIDLLSEIDPKVTFDLANSIWYRNGFQVEQEFVDVNREYFDAEVREEDFSDPATVDLINGWVEDKTNGKIDQIIEQIDGTVIMYLINAIYFKGTWQYAFDQSKTGNSQFFLKNGDPVTVPMMAQQAALPYFETDELQVVDLPYGNGQYSMTVFLPRNSASIDTLIATLDQETWDSWTSNLAPEEILLYLPRFKLELMYEKEMKEALTALGMGIAFSGAADFTGIRKSGGIFISRVIHKTFVEVDEEGTEAAAVTAVELRESAGGSTVKIMRVDRPFVFTIREHHSGTILFIGKVNNPVA